MKIISVTPLALQDIKLIRFARFVDERGYFTEVIREQDLTTAPKLPELHGKNFYQINESLSAKGVVRGLHFQWEPHMGKLVRATDGTIIDIVVDIRTDSPTFGKAELQKLSFDKKADYQDWLWIPPGFAHGFVALSVGARIEYACTGWWNPQCEKGITPNDESIDWSLADKNLLKELKEIFPNAIMNDKDKNGLTLSAWKESEEAPKYMSSLPRNS